MKELSRETVLALAGLHSLLRERRPVPLNDVAQATQSPGPLLRALFRKLQAAGLVKLRRGHGFVLARPPGEIRLLDVLRIIDAPHPPDAPCGGDYDACDSRASCILAPLCRSAEEAWIDTLRRFTLADFADVSVDLPNCLDPNLRDLAS